MNNQPADIIRLIFTYIQHTTKYLIKLDTPFTIIQNEQLFNLRKVSKLFNQQVYFIPVTFDIRNSFQAEKLIKIFKNVKLKLGVMHKISNDDLIKYKKNINSVVVSHKLTGILLYDYARTSQTELIVKKNDYQDFYKSKYAYLMDTEPLFKPSSYRTTCTITNKEVKELTNLEFLLIQNDGRITDEGIKDLTNLRSLYLDNDDITDEGIKNLTNLEALHAYNNKITDEGIKNLINLKYLYVMGTNFITQEAVDKLVNLEYVFIYKKN
jgi:hypothetical protein